MKKFILFLFIIFQFISKGEIISNYEIDINVNKLGYLDIIERISYIPEVSNKRGIIRAVPYKYKNGNYFKIEDRLAIKDFNARYLNINEFLNVKDISNTKLKMYRLGKKDVFLNSNKEYIYEIKYKVYNSLRKKDDIVQNYFNAIGTHWEIPIMKFKVKISNMDGNIEVFTGKNGEKGENYILTKEDNSFIITNKEMLNKFEGLSYILNSKSFKYPYYYDLYNKFIANMGYFMLIITIIITAALNIFLYFSKRKYENKNKKEYIVSYFPPKISPLIAKKIENKEEYTDILIIIYELVRKGIIKFKEKEKKNENQEYVVKFRYVKNTNHIFKKFDDYVQKVFYIDELKYEEEKEKLTIFEKVAISNLYLSKNDVFKSDKQLYLADYNLANIVNEYFEKRYVKTRMNKYLFLNILIIIMNAFILFMNIYNFFEIIFISFPIAITSFFISLNFIKYKEKYFEDKKEIDGFKEFLTLVEKDKFEYFSNNVEEILNYFKQILPYALALGLKNDYMKMVDLAIAKYGLDREITYNNTFYYYMLYSSVFNNNINKSKQNYTMSNSFGGNSSFKGNFSSGGFSGGGFGGGGGRSW